MFVPVQRSYLAYCLLMVVLTPDLAETQERNLYATRIPKTVRQATGFDSAASTGLFVGISQFTDESLVSVPYSVDDAIDLAPKQVYPEALDRAGRL